MFSESVFCWKKVVLCSSLLLSSCLHSLDISASLPAKMDSLLTVWSDELRPIEERLSAFDLMYQQFYEQYPDTMLHELEQLRIKAKAFNRPLILFESFIRKGGLLAYQGKNIEALLAYDQAEQVAASLEDSLRLGTVASNRGNVYAGISEYLEATEQYTLALKLYKSANYVNGQQNVRMALGNIFVFIDDYAFGKSYYESVWAELDPDSSTRFRGLLAMNRAWCEYKLGNLERAAGLYAMALELFKDENSGFYIAATYTNLARLQMDQDAFTEAKHSTQQALSLFRKLGATKDAIECQLILAQIEIETDVASALGMAESLEDDLLVLAGNESKRNFYELLYTGHKRLGNADIALKMHEQYLVFHDSVQVLKNYNLVLRTAYEKEVEREMFTLEMEGRQKNDELRIQQLQTVIWLVLAFVLVVSLLVAYIVRDQKKNRLRREGLLTQISELRQSGKMNLRVDAKEFELDRARIEHFLDRSLNETDWNVLTILLNNPSITNVQIAELAFLSVDGIGSSLRRMYGYFSVKETKYKKIALLHMAMKISKQTSGSEG